MSAQNSSDTVLANRLLSQIMHPVDKDLPDQRGSEHFERPKQKNNNAKAMWKQHEPKMIRKQILSKISDTDENSERFDSHVHHDSHDFWI